MRNRRRTDFLAPDGDWTEFPAVSHWAKGATLRLFDRETHEWSLNWAASRSGTLFPPVVGRFEGDRGEFYGDDTLPHSRLRSSGGTPIGARWEQAFSVDGGETWVTNWTMDFSRPPVS
ncbi:hypothetical protein ABZX77_48785 [Streptomyces sp. NPDC004237]|uniref:hypothetical protein n=1 Tax=Streptomyces sp. NPDC004237 TaxID=3154455 RepID=UPI0033A56F10